MNLKSLQIPRPALIRIGVVLVVFFGWFFSAWGGGMMGLWACFCTGVVGWCSGVYTCNGQIINTIFGKNALQSVQALTVVNHERQP